MSNEINQRTVSIFDTEARAARMSVLADSSLLPPPTQLRNRHSVWHGTNQANRQTWLAPVTQADVTERVWPGKFAVEQRDSWVTRTPNRWISLDDSDNLDTDAFGVEWEEDDKENPLNFGTGRKWFNAMLLAFACFIVSIASSGFSQGTEQLKSEFHISQVTALLTTSTFVLGFAVGALVLSPLSEVYGRRDLYIMTFGAFVAFSGSVGFSSSMTVVIVLRFFAGLAGSFTQAVAPAVVADMFDAQERGLVMSIFTLAGLVGQNLGPIVCGFLVKAYGWRSIAVLITATALPTWFILAFTFPETYAPVLLQRRADKLTKETGKQHLVAGMTPKPIAQQLRIGALRPWIMLIYEPIVTLLSLFLSVVHGTLFCLFAAYPIVYEKGRGWPQGVASLPFLAIIVGIMISLLYVAFVDQKRYARVVAQHNGAAPPEARLPPAMLGAAALPIGLFWFAWTNGPSVHFMVPVSAGTLFGFGMVLLYMSITNYIVDAYLGYAASALAASTVLRSVAGAAFPLFTGNLYSSLGIHWASSVPAFLALIFIPCLFAFYKWGDKLRGMTRFGAEAANMAGK
ncbi:MFS general substrate transporter [Dothidotthia symphoricarpi CBS 119687]|uniref:MFS general substrate transporter n=1 Tax=Dothidotthia symphoricarpi CBS 119687 TaxID=1392245 RepID=A0A6A6A247_9PLEO|nr:MFS general substrate transporter [Dothidotthia symphoricarpi CBS 119687]KAF2124651.1 MFS general substrate transporter [Dothidotthia symphoricarpi CBS 119687]